MEKIYYSPKGFWKGLPAVEKLSKEAKVSKKQALEFLKKQAVWQIYLPPPKKIIRPRFDASTKNEIHQADLLFLPHDSVNRKTYKSRKENPQKLTQLSSRSHPRHLVGKRTAQKTPS